MTTGFVSSGNARSFHQKPVTLTPLPMIKLVPSSLVRLSVKKFKAPATAALLLAVASVTASFIVPSYLFSGKATRAAVPNDIAITDLTAGLNTLSRLWYDRNPVKVTIQNTGTTDQNDIAVDLSVTGANTEHFTLTVPSLAAGASTTVTFTGNITAAGTQTVEATVPNDDDNSNNSKLITQDITCNTTGYTQAEPVYGGFGFGAGTGIAAAQYQAPEIPMQLTGVTVHLSSNPDCIGKSIIGVLLDESGTYIADAPPLYISAGDLNTTVQFTFYAPVVVNPNDIFYAGIQLEDAGQSPIGMALPATTVPDRYFTFPAYGGAPTPYTGGGNLKINVVSTLSASLTSSATGPVQSGEEVTFSATPGYPEYIFTVNGSIQQFSDDSIFKYIPVNNDVVSVEVGRNGCYSDLLGNYVMEVNGITPTNGILYVNKNNPTPGDGSSWANALTELADALRWAKGKEADWTAGSPLQIWVAGGTYQPLYSPADDNFGNGAGMTNAFLLVKNVKVYGGFAGTETLLTERDLTQSANKSILSGDFNEDDVIGGNAVNYDLTISNTMDNACHIVIASGDVGAAVLDGFTITGAGGDAESLEDILVNGNTITKLAGGGLHNYLSSPVYSNLVVKANKNSFYGAGIYNDQASPVFTNVLVVDNFSEFFGGGILNANLSSPVLTNLTISNNFAAVDGGGMVDMSASPVVRNTIIYGNSTSYVNDNSTPVITYSLIEGMPADPVNNILNGSIDPKFTDPAAGDYTLKTGSLAINTGHSGYYLTGQVPDLSYIQTDLAGNARVTGSTVDLGAYESNSNDQFITASDVDVTYGDADHVLTAVASSGLPVSYSMPANDVADLYQDAADNNKWKVKIKRAGAVTITASQPGDGTIDPAPDAPIVFFVNRKELVVTADDITKPFGASMPPLTISYSGFVGTDNALVITPPTISTTATASSQPGTYPILLVDGSADNYELKRVNGTFTVSGTTITITQQPEDQTICAGSAVNLRTGATNPHSVAVSYQWQQSGDKNAWNNIADANKAEYSFAAKTDAYYRCVVTAPGTEISTDPVKLTVKPADKPVINLPDVICLSDIRVSLDASLPGGVFSGTGVSGNTWKLDTLRPGLYSIQYTYENDNGCKVTATKTANLSLCSDKDKGLVSAIKAHPNPTNGLITVRVLLTDAARQSIIVSNSFGQQVIFQQKQLRKGWNQLSFDLTGYSAGIYFVTLSGYEKKPNSVITIMKR